MAARSSSVANLFAADLQNNNVQQSDFPSQRKLRERSRDVYSVAAGGGTDILSSLPLQLFLYMNVYFAPCFIAGGFLMVISKYSKVDPDFQFLPVVLFVVMAFVEPVRLYLGYAGNLQEKVPELAGFWLLSVVGQLPLALYVLLNGQFPVVPLEKALYIILMVFIGFQAFYAWTGVRMMIRIQAAKFYLSQGADEGDNEGAAAATRPPGFSEYDIQMEQIPRVKGADANRSPAQKRRADDPARRSGRLPGTTSPAPPTTAGPAGPLNDAASSAASVGDGADVVGSGGTLAQALGTRPRRGSGSTDGGDAAAAAAATARASESVRRTVRRRPEPAAASGPGAGGSDVDRAAVAAAKMRRQATLEAQAQAQAQAQGGGESGGGEVDRAAVAAAKARRQASEEVRAQRSVESAESDVETREVPEEAGDPDERRFYPDGGDDSAPTAPAPTATPSRRRRRRRESRQPLIDQD